MAKSGSEDKNKVLDLEQEVGLLRSFMIGLAGRDAEGHYQPNFVARVLASVSAKSNRVFKNSRTFLKEVRSFNG